MAKIFRTLKSRPSVFHSSMYIFKGYRGEGGQDGWYHDVWEKSPSVVAMAICKKKILRWNFIRSRFFSPLISFFYLFVTSFCIFTATSFWIYQTKLSFCFLTRARILSSRTVNEFIQLWLYVLLDTLVFLFSYLFFKKRPILQFLNFF